jgi:uncharacterized protein (TIRG00374 family)
MSKEQGKRLPYQTIFGFLISILALIALLSLTDLSAVRQALVGIKFQILGIAGALVIISLFTRAFAWRAILQERINLWQSYLIINAGYFVNTVLPFRLGELSRAFLLKPAGLGFWEALPSIVLERIIDVIFALSLLFLGLPAALGFTNDLTFAYFLAGVVVVVMFVLFWMVRYHSRILAWLERIPIQNQETKERLIRFIDSIISSLAILSSPRRILIVILGMGASWGITLGFHYFLLRAFIPDAQLAWAAFALGAVAVGASIPSSPGNIGIYEGSLTLALTFCGVEPSVAFTFAITSHIINLCITTGFGAYGLVREGVKLREVWEFGKEQKLGEKL